MGCAPCSCPVILLSLCGCLPFTQQRARGRGPHTQPAQRPHCAWHPCGGEGRVRREGACTAGASAAIVAGVGAAGAALQPTLRFHVHPRVPQVSQHVRGGELWAEGQQAAQQGEQLRVAAQIQQVVRQPQPRGPGWGRACLESSLRHVVQVQAGGAG
eukprot:CAMPEP_0173187748 /NCGR_PEP_ID=MMETSP1141-20130122/10880_1 /TAXON_ID=483371 /ORGANISM="non described non described, Strain CCMP2298" /LENGTH=156 /DNA_ID=CAMNT_0014111617 /DNA_START=120 /DNA_END=587 /DNA_ORIENTATION=-